MPRKILAAIPIACFLALLALPLSKSAASQLQPEKGMNLPSLQLPAPPVEGDREYLGVKSASFYLKDLDSQLILIELLGVYCPLCLQQVTPFNQLFSKLKNRKMNAGIKMIGVAIGGTAMEVEFLRNDGGYNYPVVQDEAFMVHKLLGEPKTPFTFLVSKEGMVLYSHQGIIEDVEPLLQIIHSHLEPK